jgi:hypothetical protein
LTVLFPAEFWLWQLILQQSSNMQNRWNNISIISKYEIYQWITVNYDIK